MTYTLGDVDWKRFNDKYGFGDMLKDLDQSLTEVDDSFGDQAREFLTQSDPDAVAELLFAEAEPIDLLLYDTNADSVSDEAREVIRDMRDDSGVFYYQGTIKRYEERLAELGVEPIGKATTRLLFTKSVRAYYDVRFDGEVVTCETVVCANGGPASYNDDMLTAVDIDPDAEVDWEPEIIPDHYGVDAVLPVRALSDAEGRTTTYTRTVRVEDAIAAGCGASND